MLTETNKETNNSVETLQDVTMQAKLPGKIPMKHLQKISYQV